MPTSHSRSRSSVLMVTIGLCTASSILVSTILVVEVEADVVDVVVLRESGWVEEVDGGASFCLLSGRSPEGASGASLFSVMLVAAGSRVEVK